MTLPLALMLAFAASSLVSGNIITKGPVNQTLEEGKTLTLNCQTSVTSVVSWEFFGKPIDTSDRQVTIDKNNNSLIITNSTFHNAGNYVCAINQSGVIVERSVPALVLLIFRKQSQYINESISIGTEILRLQFLTLSYPKFDEVVIVAPGNKPLRSNVKVFNRSYDISVAYLNSYEIKFTDIKDEDFGDYFVRYRWRGSVYTTMFATLSRTNECREGLSKCPSIPKCLYNNQFCNNYDDCGDLWDERNCGLPPPLKFLKVSHYEYKELKIIYWTADTVNRSTVIKLFKENKLVREEEFVKIRESLVEANVINGIDNNVTYNISIQSKSIAGNLSVPTVMDFYVHPKELPTVPGIRILRHSSYNSISVLLYEYADKDVSYNTTFQITDQDGRKAGNEVRLTKSDVFARLGGNNLQNGSTYTITIKSTSFLGESPKPLVVNYTIPRKVAPGPVEKLHIEYVSRRNSIWLNIKFNRPSDSGGSEYIRGKLNLCEYPTDNKLKNCLLKSLFTRTSGNQTEISTPFFSLKGNTRYQVTVFYRSNIDQEGPKTTLTFTTSAIEKSSLTSGLGTGIIVGIVLGCVPAVAGLIGVIWKALSRSRPAMGAGTVTYSSN